MAAPLSVSLAHATQFAEFFDRLSEGVRFGAPRVITPSQHVVTALMEYTKKRLPSKTLERCWLMSGARGQDAGLDKAGFVACLCLALMVDQGHSLPDAVPAHILEVAQLVSTNCVGFAFQAGTSQQQPTPPPDVPPAACRAPPGSVSTATEFGRSPIRLRPDQYGWQPDQGSARRARRPLRPDHYGSPRLHTVQGAFLRRLVLELAGGGCRQEGERGRGVQGGAGRGRRQQRRRRRRRRQKRRTRRRRRKRRTRRRRRQRSWGRRRRRRQKRRKRGLWRSPARHRG